jgi:hypothetical protein
VRAFEAFDPWRLLLCCIGPAGLGQGVDCSAGKEEKQDSQEGPATAVAEAQERE